MRSSNPVLGRITAAAQQPRYTVPGGPAAYGQQPYSYGGQTYQQPYGQPGDDQPAGYGHREVVATGRDVMTIDDVVVKTADWPNAQP